MFLRRVFITIAVVLLVCLLLLINTPPLLRQAPSDINVILLTFDSLRPDHLGCYGYRRNTSPHIDDLARQGQLFRNAFSQSAWTIPGVMSILTSLQPPVHQVEQRGDLLDSGITTIFDGFREAGYSIPNVCFLLTIPEFSTIRVGPLEEQYFSEEDNNELLRWLDEHHEEKFFIWYLYRGVHLPYKPLEDSQSALPPVIPGEEELSDGIKAVLSDAAVVPVGTVKFEPADMPVLTDLYDAEVREADMFVGRLLGALRTYGLLEKTLIVMTADHGEELMDHGFVGHASTMHSATLYDEIIRIPLIMSLPDYLPAGGEIREQVQQIDILPTILGILGFPRPTGVQGRSLIPLIFDVKKQKQSSIPVFAETVYGGYQATEEMARTRLRSVRTDGWKLIETGAPGRETYQLYNLLSDPKEFNNVYGENTQAAAAHEILLDEWKRENEVTKDVVMAAATRIFPQRAEDICPQFLFPYDGAVLAFEERGGIVRASWTGNPELTYIIEYEIGTGIYNLTGSFVAFGNRRDFGPYSREIWNSLAVRNPWRVRVSPDVHPRCWSEWVEFEFD